MFLKLFIEHHGLIAKQTLSIAQYEQKCKLILPLLTANPTYVYIQWLSLPEQANKQNKKSLIPRIFDF